MLPSTERAFYQLDLSLRLLDAGPRALAIWGKSKSDVIGRHLLEVFPFAESSPVYEALVDASRTLKPKRLKADSLLLKQTVEVEIYPVNGGLQVSFWPNEA